MAFYFLAFFLSFLALFFSRASFIENGIKLSNPRGNMGPDRDEDDVGRGLEALDLGPTLLGECV